MSKKIDKYRINDEVFAAAYISIDSQLKAKIKNALAFFEHYYNFVPKYVENSKITELFYIKTQFKALKEVNIVIDSDFNQLEKLIALVMPAILAGVKDINIFFIKNHTPNMLVSLELMGIENNFCVPSLDYTPKGSYLLTDVEQYIGQIWSSYHKTTLIEQNKDEKLELIYIFSDILVETFQNISISVKFEAKNGK